MSAGPPHAAAEMGRQVSCVATIQEMAVLRLEQAPVLLSSGRSMSCKASEPDPGGDLSSDRPGVNPKPNTLKIKPKTQTPKTS